MRKNFRTLAVMLVTGGLSVFVIMPSAATEYGWQLGHIGVTPAMHQNSRMRGKGVTVGVFDSGIDCAHPSLASPANRCETVYPPLAKDSEISPGDHGTFVSTMLGGSDQAGEVVGMAPDAKIAGYAMVVGEANWGYNYSAGVMPPNGGDALDYLIEFKGISVSNHSYGLKTLVGLGIAPYEYRMMTKYPKNVFVWAAGNDGRWARNLTFQDSLQARDRLKNFIVVVAVYEDNRITSFSNEPHDAGFCNISSQVCLERNKLKYFTVAAPGAGLKGGEVGGGYILDQGTSYSAPLVAGLVAQLQGYWPALKQDASKVTNIIFGTAQDIGDPGVDGVFGWGLVRADRALSPIGATYLSGAVQLPGANDAPEENCLSESTGSIYTPGSTASSCSSNTGSNIYSNPDSSADSEEDGEAGTNSAGRLGRDLSGGRAVYSVAESQLKVSPALAALTQHSITFFDQYDRDFQMPLATYVTSYQGALRRWMERTIYDGPFQVFDDGKLSARFSSLHYDSQDPKFAGIDLQMRYQPGDGSQFFFGQGSSLNELSLPGRLSFGLTSDKATRGGGYPVMGLAEGGTYLAAQWPTVLGWQMTGGVLSNAAFDSDADDRQNAPQAEALVFSLARASDDLGLAGNVSVTYLEEDDGVLGTGGTGGLSFTDESYSQAVTFGTTYQFGEHSKIAASYTHAWSRTDSDTGQLLNLESSALNSSSFTIGVESGSIFGRADRLRFAVSQPLRVDGGKMRLTHDDYYDEDLVLHNRTVDIDLSPTGRQFDYQVEYTLPTAIPGSRVGLFGYFSDDSLHQEAFPTYGLGVRLGATF